MKKRAIGIMATGLLCFAVGQATADCLQTMISQRYGAEEAAEMCKGVQGDCVQTMIDQRYGAEEAVGMCKN